MEVTQSTPLVTTHGGLNWLILANEASETFTNFGDGREGDASSLVARVNSDPTLNQGHFDWRLPTIDELKTLIGTRDDPKAGWFWSSSPFVGDPNYAWVVTFLNGYVHGYDPRYDGYHVRLVRTSGCVSRL